MVRLGLAVGYVWVAVVMAFAQGAPASQSGSVPRGGEVGADYTYARQCGCFSLQGGNAWFAYKPTHWFAVVAEVNVQRTLNIRGSGEDLTLTSYLFGPRYSWPKSRHFAPFAQVLLGGAHASGSAAVSQVPPWSNAFGMVAGGGLDIELTPHYALRAFEADDYLTRFPNSANEPQNYLRLSAGVVFRFGE